MVRCPTGHHWHCNWPVQKASRGMCPVQMVDIWTLVVNKLLQTICIFHVFLVHVASVHCVRFLLCWCLMVDKRTLLNSKVLIKLVKDSEWTKSKMLLFYIVLINRCTYFHDIWQISVASVIKSHTWDVLRACKVQISDFKVFQGYAATQLRCGG